MDGRLASSRAGVGTYPQSGAAGTGRQVGDASGNMAWSLSADGTEIRFRAERVPDLDEKMAKRRKRLDAADEPMGLNNVLQLAVILCQQLELISIPYCVIGGVAYQRWGEPRQTVDVDATLFVGFGTENFAIERMLSCFESRIDSPLEFALQNRILLLRSKSGTDIDLSLGGLPFEERLIQRSSCWDVPRHGLVRTCSAEDLIVLKAFASRPQDWIDVEKVIIRQGERLDRALILEELAPLSELKEEPEILEHVGRLFGSNK